mmetsp:Transcript_4490/g.16111  ORF Transcript_4490/g.16111 Transcript_4490/m.16111 type:complete len:194 (-) Transcript_4490:396-977(-)
MEAETKKVYLSRYQKVREDDLKRGRFGYAKLQWKNREFFIQKRLIHLGRHSTNTDADVDLGEEMNLSRKHAAIRYNEEKETFELEVLGKNGAFVRGVLITKDQPPIALANRDLIQVFKLQREASLIETRSLAQTALRNDIAVSAHVLVDGRQRLLLPHTPRSGLPRRPGQEGSEEETSTPGKRPREGHIEKVC